MPVVVVDGSSALPMTTEITFERAAFYEEVWTTALTRLGEKYGLSDNGLRKICKALRKICKALHIPLPPFGHSARVEPGQAVKKTPLPPTHDRTTFVNRPRSGETTFDLAEDDVWLAERTAFEALAENRIVVEPKPNCWHAAVAPLRDVLREAVKEVEEARRHAERTKGKKVWNEPDFKGAHWRSFLHSGQILLDTHRPMPLRATPLSYERALVGWKRCQ